MSTIKLIQGDCLEVMRTFPAASFDLIACDLPYEITDCVWDSMIPLEPLWAEYRRLLAPRGCVVLTAAMPFTAALYASNPAWYRDHNVWDKNKCGSPGLANVRPMRVHEDILIFAPAGYTYNPQMEAGEPYSRKSKKPEGYVGRKNDHGYGLKPRTEFHNTGTRYPKSILRIPRDFSAQQQVHPAQKPVALFEYLFLTYSNAGARILDNAAGSFTSAVAAVSVGDREYVGIELDRDPQGNPLGYLDIGRERVVQAQIERFEREVTTSPQGALVLEEEEL